MCLILTHAYEWDGTSIIASSISYNNSVDSGSPRVTAHLTGNPMRRCTLHISWIIPDITAISDITHFMIYIDGVNVYNQTNSNNETFLSLSYFVHSCSPHNVSISIVNSCGQVSPPSLTISIVSPEPIICEDTMCEDSAITGHFWFNNNNNIMMVS